MFPEKRWQKNNIPAHAGHFLRTEIDSTDFENENLTAKIRKNKAEQLYFFKKNIPKNPETDETTKWNKYLKKFWTRNKSSKIAKMCSFTRYKR